MYHNQLISNNRHQLRLRKYFLNEESKNIEGVIMSLVVKRVFWLNSATTTMAEIGVDMEHEFSNYET